MDRLFIGGRASRPCTNTAPTPAQARLLVSRGPCRAFKGRLSARFVESTHSLERQPAQAGLRVDLGVRERTENVAAVHTQTPESSHRRRSSSRPPSTALGGSAATRAIHVWDRADQRRRTRPRPSRPAQPSGCSGHPAGSSSGRSTVPPSTARGATWTRTTTTPRGGAAGRETTPHRPACTPSHFAGDCEGPWGPKYQFNYKLF